MDRDGWTFITNHGHALVCVAADPHVRLRDVALQLRVTERCAQQIVSDLEASGVIQRTKTGRRNSYVVHRQARFRHPLESDLTVGEFLDLVSRARSRSDEASSVAAPRSAAPWQDGQMVRLDTFSGHKRSLARPSVSGDMIHHKDLSHGGSQ